MPLPYALPDRGTAERSCTPLARAVCSPSTLALQGRNPSARWVHSRSPSTPEHMCTPRTPLTVVANVSGPDRRLPGFYETMLGCISTCSSRAFQRFHSRVRQPPSWLSGFESTGVQNQVRPPVLTTATLYPDRGTAEPSCTLLRVPRAAQAPCIACRTHSAQAVRVPRPEHAHTHRPPCRPHVAGAYVSGPGWRLPRGVREDLLWRDLYVRVTASFQRCHARVRLLPCVVASCCLLWCLALWPVRG